MSRVIETQDREGRTVKVIIEKPTQSQLNESQLRYNVAWAEAMRQGALLRAEAEEIIAKRKLWDDQKEKKFNELRYKLRQMEMKLRDIDKLEDEQQRIKQGRPIALEMRKLRTQLNRLNESRNEVLSRTAERYAEGVQVQCLMPACVKWADTGEHVFQSEDDIQDWMGTQLFVDVTTELLGVLWNIDMSQLRQEPENRWLIKHKLMDAKTGFFLDEQGRLVDEEGRLVNERGEFIDEKGRRVDEFGLPLEDESTVSTQQQSQPKQADEQAKPPPANDQEKWAEPDG